MIQVWRNYKTDLGRAYPMYALSVSQVNDVPTTINPVDLLPGSTREGLFQARNSCGVNGLTPRQLSLWTTDGANFLLTYPQPFNENLAQYLTANTQVQAWEFIGEQIRYGRLRRMLDNVRP